MNERKKQCYYAECLICSHKEQVWHESKEDYKEITICPKCSNRTFVDVWKNFKYTVRSDQQKGIKKMSKEIEEVENILTGLAMEIGEVAAALKQPFLYAGQQGKLLARYSVLIRMLEKVKQYKKIVLEAEEVCRNIENLKKELDKTEF